MACMWQSAFDMISVRVLGSGTWSFAAVPWRTRLFITDSGNWEEGASAKAALSASLAFCSPDKAHFSFLVSHLWLLASEIVSLDMILSIRHWGPGVNSEYTHSLSQAHCSTAAALPPTRSQLLVFNHKHSFCKRSSWRVAFIWSIVLTTEDLSPHQQTMCCGLNVRYYGKQPDGMISHF